MTHIQMPSDDAVNPAVQWAWVVFSGQADLPWLRVLKPGFRHCYVLINDGRCWYSVDSMSNLTDINIHHHVPPSFDLPAWLEERGLRVLRCPVVRPVRPAPWMPFTCVEAVKRVLGLHSFWIWTPWQLYCRLTHSKSDLPSRYYSGVWVRLKQFFNTSHPSILKGDTPWEV